MNNEWLAGTMKKIHRHCDLLSNGDASAPGNLDVGATMKQLKQVAALAVVYHQEVLLELLGDSYQRNKVRVFLDANQRCEFPLELLEGVDIVRLDLELLNRDDLVVVATLVDLTCAARTNHLEEFNPLRLNHNVGR